MYESWNPMEPLQPNFPDPRLIGQFPTFGVSGPAYRILESLPQTENGEWLVRIRVLESGEETEYPYLKAVSDPEAE